MCFQYCNAAPHAQMHSRLLPNILDMFRITWPIANFLHDDGQVGYLGKAVAAVLCTQLAHDVRRQPRAPLSSLLQAICFICRLQVCRIMVEWVFNPSYPPAGFQLFGALASTFACTVMLSLANIVSDTTYHDRRSLLPGFTNSNQEAPCGGEREVRNCH